MGGVFSPAWVEPEQGPDNKVTGLNKIPVPDRMRQWCIWAIDRTEEMRGQPGTLQEISGVFYRECTTWLPFGVIFLFLQNYYREDHFYTDEHFNHWTTKPREGFELYSQKFKKQCMTYKLRADMTLCAGPQTPVWDL